MRGNLKSVYFVLLLLVLVPLSFLFYSNAIDIGLFKSTHSRPTVLGDRKEDPDNSTPNFNAENLKAPNYDEGIKVIKAVLDSMLEIKPGAGPLNNEQHYFRNVQDDADLRNHGDLPLTSEILGMYLQLSGKEKESLRKSHKRVMDILPNSINTNAFTGRGIVTTGGGTYFPMVLTLIKWVRDQDPETPIEVFMLDESEYETAYCDHLFPSLNVECIVADHIFGDKLSKKLKSKFALKPLAMLASKFDDIYFTDADSFPILDISGVFDWQVYKDVGYILNRDYWPRTTSPHYYEIADHPLGERARGDNSSKVLLQEDRENALIGGSSESGQIFVNKSKHIRSLMLAMYYNLYGVDVYFPMFIMGNYGAGDKDTYVPAATICHEKFHQTNEMPIELGQWHNGKYDKFVMVQPDPRDDYEKHINGVEDTILHTGQLHINLLKSNVRYLLVNNKHLKGYPGFHKTRYFGDLEKIHSLIPENVDIELRFFDTMRYVACNWALRDNYIPHDWRKQDVNQFCRVLTAHTQFLKENAVVDEAVENDYWLALDQQNQVPEVVFES